MGMLLSQTPAKGVLRSVGISINGFRVPSPIRPSSRGRWWLRLSQFSRGSPALVKRITKSPVMAMAQGHDHLGSEFVAWAKVFRLRGWHNMMHQTLIRASKGSSVPSPRMERRPTCKAMAIHPMANRVSSCAFGKKRFPMAKQPKWNPRARSRCQGSCQGMA